MKPNGAECNTSTPPRFILSRRQTETLERAARGWRDREIAADLDLAPQTVRHILQAARRRLQARNTTHAVAIALSDHLITLED